MDTKIFRPEFPRPQFVRDSWENLNGVWDFEFDYGNSGYERGLLTAAFSKKINVPFCPESKLSGLEHKDFCTAVWYRRKFAVDAQKLEGRVLVHFGAVDYEATVWVNGALAGSHTGGYVGFTFDITALLNPGENEIVVRAFDDNRSGKQPRGKQSALYNSHGCDYTRTTGIWQTVWLEFVPKTYIASTKITTNYKSGLVSVDVKTDGCRADMSVEVRASFAGKEIAFASQLLAGEQTRVCFTVENPKLWAPGEPNLYDIEYKLVRAGETIDTATGYFGVRTVEIRGKGFYINGKPVFMRTILDQGFYPDGIYTAPSDADLKRDIELCMALGFNGARLHEKVFEERFLYWADKLGYIVWGEHANWGLLIDSAEGISGFLPEWLEIVNRDFNHPAIIGWCPFNETWDRQGRQQDDNVLRIIYLATKAIDPTRPCIDTSGNYHVMTDIFDQHDYEQNAEIYAQRYSVSYDELYETYPKRQKKEGQPFFMSEYGGAFWAPGRNDGWGYGNAPKTDTEVGERFRDLSGVLLDNPDIIGYCYTQLTDIEQEQNGLYTYERKRKFSDAVYEMITETNRKEAAFEKKYR